MHYKISSIVRLLLALFLILNANYLYAQKTVTVPDLKHITAGEIITNGELIKAIQYEFPDTIRYFHIDSLSGNIAIHLRSQTKSNNPISKYSDKILLFDPELKQVIWEKNIVSPVEKYFHFNSALLRLSGNKSYLVDIRTGESIWSLKNIIYHVNAEKKMGLGYRYNHRDGISNTLDGINFETGEQMWERDINRKFGWGDIVYLNDTTILVADEGLHKIYLKDGLGWDYKTGEVTVAQNVPAIYKEVIIKRSIVAGSFIVNYKHKNSTEIGSKVFVDGDHIYFASSKEVSALTADGDVLWENLLSENLVGDTRMFLKGEILYIVNLGFNTKFKIKDAEKPFFAAYNKNTGSQIFKQVISNNNERVSFIKLVENSIFVFLKKRVAQYSIDNGIKLQDSKFDSKLYGDIKSPLNNRAINRDEDSKFYFLDVYNPQKNYIYTSKGMVICLDASLKVTEKMHAENLWIFHSENDGFKIIVNRGNTYILDSNNEILGSLNASSKLELSGSKLYDNQGKNLIEYDLQSFFDLKLLE